MNIFELLIVQPIFNLLIGIYSILPGGDFGISLILFTILVRFGIIFRSIAIFGLFYKDRHLVISIFSLPHTFFIHRCA